MQIFASTTYLGPGRTPVDVALAGLEECGLDGVELGSTHVWAPNFGHLVKKAWPSRVLSHNYFPPAESEIFLNLASSDEHIRSASISHAKSCLIFAKEVGAELYTVHPGFLADPRAESESDNGEGYDLVFADSLTGYHQAFELMVNSLDELVTHARRLGLRLAVETEGSLTRPGVSLLEREEEYQALFERIPNGLWLNLNLAHTMLGGRAHGYSVQKFITSFRDRIAAVEASHNDGRVDQHKSLVMDSYVLDLARKLPDVPVILEFRNATSDDVAESVTLLRNL